MHEYLVANGYVSILGDPCLFRKVLPDGGIVMACTYIDDVTYGASSSHPAQRFLFEMRERFVIEEGEGKQIGFLLGMAVTQNPAACTNSALVFSRMRNLQSPPWSTRRCYHSPCSRTRVLL